VKNRIPLTSAWTLSFTHPRTGKKHQIPAAVPGNVESDLLRAGLVADLYPADHPTAMYDWELVDDWTYRTHFPAPTLDAGNVVELVFEGIDTVAEVLLNGKTLFRSADMFIPHTADVTSRLKPEDNILEVRIFSAELQARRFEYDATTMTMARHEGCARLRKARHMWGWDNAPRLLCAGLWRPVYLAVKNAIRFENVYIYTCRANRQEAVVGLDWQLITPDLDLRGYRGKIVFGVDGKTAREHEVVMDQTFGRTRITIPTPLLWWPRDYGEAALYDVEFRLETQDGTMATWHTRFGIREIDLIRTPTTDEQGSGEFLFRCNGEKIYCRGTNWKTTDALPSRSGGDRLRRALELCTDCNCNIVRIWGGGIYEDHEFFDYCDAHGLMVWQDFMLACEFPPQDEDYQQMMATEAEIIIKRLRNHSSLVLWCGDNETDMSVFGGALPPQVRPSDNILTRLVLKKTAWRFDPYRPYLESSPYVDDIIFEQRKKYGENAITALAPEQHFYTWQTDFRTAFRRVAAHFISETGPICFSAMSESDEFAEREQPRLLRLWDVEANKEWDWRHQADAYFLQWKNSLRANLQFFFNREFDPGKLAELRTATNIMVADLFKFAIESSRIRKWRKTGVIWWSLLDMWPMMFNFSVVDYHFRKKLPYYWIRQSQQPLCLMAEDGGDNSFSLFAVNDTLRKQSGTMRLYGVDADGKETVYQEREFRAEANASTRIEEKVVPPSTHGLGIIEWEVEHRKYYNHFMIGTPPFSFAEYSFWSSYLDRLYNHDEGEAEEK